MKCESCGLESKAGQSCTFYYGKLTGTTSAGKSIISRYNIAGAQDLYLCNSCIARHSEMNARKMGLIVTAIPVVIGLCFLSSSLMGIEGGFEAVKPLMGIFWMALFGPFLYLIRRSIWQKDAAGVGDSLAIKLRKRELKKAGFDSFFTREQLKRMGGTFPG